MSFNLRKQVIPRTIKIYFGAIKTQNLHLGGTLKSYSMDMGCTSINNHSNFIRKQYIVKSY
ncbi:hypothetical protein CT694_34610 (plasmid) [Bacillus wiedmannii bv. thuringiensis]|nr:hypothetical protein CT694_34610 [Bacillus wiedmannii bv. thuringiensis]